jgi:16S rRNA (guanine966-N2)-methyltransferase
MRIGGGAGSRRSIRVPRKGVRPTKAIVREAIFNIIGDRIHKASALDIFAGSGALGMEAISRGAEHCTFVEKKPQILRRNITDLSLQTQVKVLALDFRRALRLLRKQTFDLILADPPYDRKLAQITTDLVSRYALLSSDGLLIIEHSPRENISTPETLTVFKQKTYGDTIITLLEHGICRKKHSQKAQK